MAPIDLVTGGSGFIGRHLVEVLLAAGRGVRVLDPAEPRGMPAPVDYRRGSILDGACLSEAMAGVERVYHLAGIAHLWCADRAAFARVNAGGTQRVLAAAPRGARVVHCSTEVVLLGGARSDDPVRDDGLPAPDAAAGPYTRSKSAAERAVLTAAQAGRDVVIASPTVPIGPYDWNRTPPTAMLSLFLRGHASAYLDCTLNLVDVRDVAAGLALVGARGACGQRYLLGGENVRLRRLLADLERLSGRPMPSLPLPGGAALAFAAAAEWFADHVSRRPPVATREGVRLALRSAPIDDSRARRELGYRPRPIDEALARAVAWLAPHGLHRAGPLLVGQDTESAT